jgi:hypothetical protein
MNTIWAVDQESQDLDLHVQLCSQRYKELDERLTNLESKVDKISEKIDTFKSDFVKILVTTAGSVIVALIGCAGVIVNHIK